MNDSLVKQSGQVFTPDFIVENILDMCDYRSAEVCERHIIDNSCGDGAFLCVVVKRYCTYYLEKHNDISELKRQLQTYVHGIELDELAYKNCLYNLNEAVRPYGLEDVLWDVTCADALTNTSYLHKMHYVVGNPPYVRVHHLKQSYEQVKKFVFANGGMTDLYLAFFELGFNMLNEEGKLCYITPSSWLSSLAAANMRKFVQNKRILKSIVDLGHFQAFDGITTYTMITLCDATHRAPKLDYYTYDIEQKDKKFVETLSYSDIQVGRAFYVSDRKNLTELKKIKYGITLPKHCIVKNGFATLADKVFIGDIPFESYTIPVIKASTGKWYKGFFPYDKYGKPYDKETLFGNTDVAQYLNSQKETLLKGRKETEKRDWYLYGRTQALKDVYANKYAINAIIKDIDSIKLNKVPEGSGVYSGLYILTTASFDSIKSIIKTQDFIHYIQSLKNYKSGGYYTFNTKDLECYINYKLSMYGN